MYYGNNDFRDYIAHANDHKYVRKEWKNGKWKYYYPEDVKGASNAVGRFIGRKTKQVSKFAKKKAGQLNRQLVKYDYDGDGKVTKKGLIDRFDYNDNGKIGKNDLKKELQFQKIKAKGAAKSALYKTDRAIKKHAELIDTDGNKKITLDEMKSGAKRNVKYAKNKIRDARHDTNKDGTVDKKERIVGTSKDVAKKGSKAIKKTIKKIKYDSNRDGNTSQMEWAKGAASDVAKKAKKTAKRTTGKVERAAKGSVADRAKRKVNEFRYDSNRDGNTSQMEWAKGTVQDKYKKAKRKRKVKKVTKKAKQFIYDHTDKAR